MWMNRFGKLALAFGCVVLATRLEAAEFEVVPVGSSAPFSITGADMTVQQGAQRVSFDVFVNGWAPRSLAGFQFQIADAVFLSGLQAPSIPCTDAAPCVAAFGGGAVCSPVLLTCFITRADQGRADWVFLGESPIVASNDAHEIAAQRTSGGTADPGTRRYVGSFTLDLAANTGGTIVIGLTDDSSRTFLVDSDSQLILPVTITPGRIIVIPPPPGRCCFNVGPGTTQCIDGVQSDACDQQLAPRVFTPSATCAQGCPQCANDAQCADGVFCNGDERCDFALGCVPSFFRDCEEGNACTLDSCNEETNTCEHIPNQACEETKGSCCNRTPSAGGACVDQVRQDECVGLDRFWDGDLTCSEVQCQEIGGACCDTTSGTCTETLVTACQGTQKIWSKNKTCSQVTCDPPPISCCRPNGACLLTSASSCQQVGGATVAACLDDLGDNGLDDACEGDCDHDGIANVDEDSNAQRDCNNNLICDGIEIAGGASDCDGNGILDACETDCNGNGIKDSCESLPDLDGNGTPDACDPDCDHDGIPDSTEIANCGVGDASCQDCNGDGIPDGCQDLGSCCYEPFGHPVCFMTNQINCVNWFGGVWDACGTCDTITDAIEFNEGGTIFHHRVNSDEHCAPHGGFRPPSRAGCGTGPFHDAWVSRPGGGAMCETFGTVDNPALPSDFFGPGSDPFTGTICYAGVSLGLPGFGNADTLIARSADPFDRCSLPSPTEVQVSLNVEDLHLRSTSPIVVTYNGGLTPEAWDVIVRRSAMTPVSGVLTATKTWCNGGTYTNLLNVQPKLTFVKVGSPGTTAVLDTGVLGMPPVTLSSPGPIPWVHDLDPRTTIAAELCTTFHPGVVDTVGTSNCDCNGNGIRDACDIESGFSQDCNGNGVPDICDIDFGGANDCNQNDVPDSCEPDCNGNDVADACDLSGSASTDTNGNAVPDECERGVRPPSGDGLTRNRYASFRPGTRIDGSLSPVVQAFRVTSPNYPGLVKWVGPPDANNRISRLQCTPNFQVWGFGLVHIADADIVPGKTYVVKGIAQGYPLNAEVAFSDPATSIPTTTKFGDIITPIGTVNFQDVAALVAAFQGKPNAPSRSVADIHPEVPNKLVNFQDIALDVAAFQGKPFPYAGPVNCP